MNGFLNVASILQVANTGDAFFENHAQNSGIVKIDNEFVA